MQSATGTLTVRGYAAQEDRDEGRATELVQGTVVREPRPSARHGLVQFELARRLGNWVKECGRGEVLGESGFIIREEPATVRGPDVAVLLNVPLPESIGEWIRGSPDIAIEVLSPSDTSTDVQHKVLDYLEAGGARVWIVDPEAHTITVYRSDGGASFLRHGDTLRDDELLPGFSIALAALFR